MRNKQAQAKVPRTWAVTPARQGAGMKAPGAEQSAPELHVIPGGHARQVPNRAPSRLTRVHLSHFTVRYRVV